MNEAKKETPSRSDATRGIGAHAAKKRMQLERFDEERKKLQEKLRQERDQLARDVAEVEARDRRRQRNKDARSPRRAGPHGVVRGGQGTGDGGSLQGRVTGRGGGQRRGVLTG